MIALEFSKAWQMVAIIGDGSITGGMAYEAMNNAGHMHSRLVVILNDNDMSIAPPTGAMSGRPGKPASHWWYVCDGMKTRKHQDPVSKKMIVELRSTGAQTVVGPSIHPSGEPYDPLDGEPAVVDAGELAAAVAALALVACAGPQSSYGPLPVRNQHPAQTTVLHLDPDRVVAGSEEARRAVAWAVERISSGPVLIASSAPPEQVAALQSRHGRDAAGHAIEQAMAERGPLAEVYTRSGDAGLFFGDGCREPRSGDLLLEGREVARRLRLCPPRLREQSQLDVGKAAASALGLSRQGLNKAMRRLGLAQAGATVIAAARRAGRKRAM